MSPESAEPEPQNGRGGARWTPFPGAARTREPEPPPPRRSASIEITEVQVRTHSSRVQATETGVELIGIENICLAALGQLIRREEKGWRTGKERR